MIPQKPVILSVYDAQLHSKAFWTNFRHGAVVRRFLKVSASTVIMQAKLRIAYQSGLVGFS